MDNNSNENSSIFLELSKEGKVGTIGGFCEDGFPLYCADEKMAQMLGYDNVDDLTKGINNLVSNTIHHEDLDRVLKDLNNGNFFEGMTYKTTYRMPKKDGSWFWTVDKGKVIKTVDDRLAIVSICYDMTDFIDRHNKLERQNLTSKLTFENMPGGYHRCANKDGFPFIYISKRFLDIFGWTKQDIETKFDNKFINMLHPDDKTLVSAYVKNIDTSNYSNKTSDVIYRMLGKDGYIWVSDASSIVRVDEDVFYQGTLTNISDFVNKIEKQNISLKENNLKLEELRDIISSSKMGTWSIELYDDRPSCLNADERMLEVLGIQDKNIDPEATYDFWYSRICKESIPLVLDCIQSMKDGNIDEITYLWNHPTLGTRYVRCGGAGRNIEGGYLLRGYHYDVDNLVKEQIHQHEMLKNALALEKKHADTINTLATLYTTMYLIDLNNHNYEIVKGINENMHKGKIGNFDNVIKTTVEKNVVKDMVDDVLTFLNLDTLNERLKDIDTVTIEHLNNDGKWYISRFIVKSRNKNGDVQIVLFVSRDITDEKTYELKLQEELRGAALEAKRANVSKTSFLRRMSHDIRTPLNGIIGLLNLSEKYEDDPILRAEYKNKMLKSADYLLELVNNVLDIGKLESGNIDLENKEFCIDDIFNKVFSTTEIVASENNIKIYKSFNIKHHNLIGSSLHLNRILMNIASNAIKYNKKGGSVNFICEEIKDDDKQAIFKFVCVDTGLGMSKEFQSKAFEPFAQENKKSQTGFSGSGLGLAIVKDIVEKMNGTIKLESEENVGTTFTITLPFEIAYSNNKKEKDDSLTINLKGKKALIVEDNEINTEIARMLLEDEGLIIEEAHNGKQAVDRVKENVYDYIFMDVMMPVMDGLQATKEIRNLEAVARTKKGRTPIIAMTANAFNDDKKACIDAGMDGHISKPLDIKNIIEVLKQLTCH